MKIIAYYYGEVRKNERENTTAITGAFCISNNGNVAGKYANYTARIDR